ncbi:MAG: hypothetical protein ACT4PS_16490 [Betaproteobacteria bacterium]
MSAKRFGVILTILLITALAGCAAQTRHDQGPAWPDQSYPTD